MDIIITHRTHKNNKQQSPHDLYSFRSMNIKLFATSNPFFYMKEKAEKKTIYPRFRSV